MSMAVGMNDRDVLRRLLGLFVAFAVISLLAGASRMCPPLWQLQSFGDVLRVREALSMFIFAPAISVVFWLLYRTIGRGNSRAEIDVLMLLAVYFVACGMGLHDPANRIGIVYRQTGALSPEVQQSLTYLDDQLGHWVFWAGFVLGTWVMGIQQALKPLDENMAWPWRIGLGAVSAAFLWVMLTNLWNEYPKTRADLSVIFFAVLVPVVVHVTMCRKTALMRLPVLFVIYPAYFGSIAGTLICWLVRYGKV